MCVRVCVLSRFLLHVVILEFLKLALFNDTVARVTRKRSHGVCMHKCTPCTAAVLLHVYSCYAVPVLSNAHSLSWHLKEALGAKQIPMYVHTHIQTGSEYGALAENLICLHFEVSWTTQ